VFFVALETALVEVVTHVGDLVILNL
jgi:hypothetical protein